LRQERGLGSEGVEAVAVSRRNAMVNYAGSHIGLDMAVESLVHLDAAGWQSTMTLPPDTQPDAPSRWLVA
jgi:hypothetical protein